MPPPPDVCSLTCSADHALGVRGRYAPVPYTPEAVREILCAPGAELDGNIKSQATQLCARRFIQLHLSSVIRCPGRMEAALGDYGYSGDGGDFVRIGNWFESPKMTSRCPAIVTYSAASTAYVDKTKDG